MATKTKAAAKGAGKAATAVRERPELSPNAVKVLQTLAKAGRAMTREEMSNKTGIAKGWSKLLGASTKDGFGESSEGLEPRGFVRSSREEGERQIKYEITKSGKQALERALKAQG